MKKSAKSNSLSHNVKYAGFWIRFAASIVDTIFLSAIILPILLAVYGKEYFQATGLVQGPVDFLLTWVFPIIAVLVFWFAKSATPGKMLFSIKIVDAQTGAKPSVKHFIIRYLGYYVSMLPLFLGFIWVAFDKRKQGWHDKLAGTVVIYGSSQYDSD